MALVPRVSAANKPTHRVPGVPTTITTNPPERVHAMPGGIEPVAVAASTRAPSSVEVHLLGLIDYDRCLALQQRLVDESLGRADRRASVLLCEHPTIVTVGRNGSWRQLRHGERELVRQGVALRWSNRGGGCFVHTPGQLAIYPVVPLDMVGWSVGQYLERLCGAMRMACDDVHVETHAQPPGYGLWARGGRVAAVGVAVKHAVTYHGAFLNVEPAMQCFEHLLRTDAVDRSTSLAAELRRRLPMPRVRSCVVNRLAAAFDCDRLYVTTGHPLLQQGRSCTLGEVAGVA